MQGPASCPCDAVGAAEDVEHVHQAGDVGIVSHKFVIFVLGLPLLLYGVDKPLQPTMMELQPAKADAIDVAATSPPVTPDQYGGDRSGKDAVALSV